MNALKDSLVSCAACSKFDFVWYWAQIHMCMKVKQFLQNVCFYFTKNALK